MTFGLVLLAAVMIVSGILHFAFPRGYARTMPSYIPAHIPLVYISGVFEILGGVGILLPSVRVAAAWGLILLFIAIFPANVNMAVKRIGFTEKPPPAWILWLRLPLQIGLIAWAYAYTH